MNALIISRYGLALLLAFTVVMAPVVSAQASEEKSYLLAQVDPDEAYDPFIDYSEFEEESDEEADINFFRNGRFLTMGIAGGMRGFTGNMGDAYTASPTFGLFLTYFFDLRLALALGFQTGDHAVAFKTQSDSFAGNVSLTSINFDLKYYFNTQNVTRGLADLNPYLIVGVAQFYRTYVITNLADYSRDSTMGVDIGAGIEIPLLRKKAFLGIQGVYNYVNFADENKVFIGNDRIEKPISGDFFNILMILGMNF